MLECVINISEGRRPDVIAAIAARAGRDLLDVHTDVHHNRSVLTVAGEVAAREIARATIELIDLRLHSGVHPRIGALDVVPFVPLDGSDMAEAVDARDHFTEWAADELALPCFRYGPERSLPDVRRGAFTTLAPDTGPPEPHPSAGAAAVGARPVLVAYNVWLAQPDLATAKRVAAAVRGPALRALGLSVGERSQVSMNLIDPHGLGPAAAYDLVASLVPVAGAELVGLVPAGVLATIEPRRWNELDLAEDRTIEARLVAAGYSR